MLAPYRGALLMMASGEDGDGQAKATLCAVPASVWVRLRPSVVAFLPKVRGVPGVDLGELMRSHGELEEATRMLTSRSAVRRARAAYLFGLVRDPDAVALLLPLLGDPDADVRLVAVRSLGNIGDPQAASGVLRALQTQHGQIGLPAWIAAEALLSMGVEIGPALGIGLVSEDPAVRNVCAMVAGHGANRATVPQLRILLATDSDGDVRASAAVALGRVGGAQDAAALALYADASQAPSLRRTCVTALGDLGNRESLKDLTRLLGDADRRLAALAADSMVRIGSEGIAILEETAATRGQGLSAQGLSVQGLGAEGLGVQGLGAGGLSARAASGALELAGLRGQLVVGEAGG
jgi:HEAT repeat protein